MPSITLTAGQTRIIGAEEPVPAGQNPRKSLVLVLVSGDGYWGWTSTVTAAGQNDAGIPLTVGTPIAFDAESFRMQQTLRVFSPSGGVINYQENTHL